MSQPSQTKEKKNDTDCLPAKHSAIWEGVRVTRDRNRVISPYLWVDANEKGAFGSTSTILSILGLFCKAL